MNKWTRSKFQWHAEICVLAASLLLIGCNSESAQLWELVDPGGGGAAPAVYHVPDSDHIFVGSDVGGFRYSADSGKQFQVINEGVDFGSSAGDNIQDITGYKRGDIEHVVGSATAGLLYWRSVGPDGLAPEWVSFFDSRQPQRNGATTFGPLAVDPSGEHLFAAIGNVNNLALNRLTELDPVVSGRIYAFRIANSDDQAAPPEAAGFISLSALCEDLDSDPYLHVTDLTAVVIDGSDYLIAGTSEGVIVLKNPLADAASCERRTIPGHNSFVLSAVPSSADPRDVVVLLNEGNLDRQRLKSEKSGRKKNAQANAAGGLFHSRNILDAVPLWEDITPADARGEAVGKVVRGSQRPGELVLSGDAASTLGVLFTPDFSRGKWRTAIDRSFVSAKGKNREFDGWRRYNSSLKGVKEIAAYETAEGISTLYVAGFQGMVLSGRRDGDSFRFSQSYTNSTPDGDSFRFQNRGLPLMNPWQAITDSRRPEQTIFLYHDNLFFVGDNRDASFRRPLSKFGWGTGVAFDPDVSRIFVSYSIGNHLESGRRKTAQRGGIMVGVRDATQWQEFSPRLPETGPVENVVIFDDQLCANVYRDGVYCTPIHGEVRPEWSRLTPATLEVLHMLEVPDNDSLLLVVAAGQNRRICQLTASGLDCSVLPVKGGEFDRLWFDDGTLWLSTNKDQSYTSPLAGTLNWTPVAAAITDLRSVRAGGEPVAMIASGIEGIFASRTPQDRGSWCEVSRDGLNGNRVVKSISNPAGSDYLHIAVAGVGFYRASLEDLAAELARNCL